jgi:hypothetical protein
MKPNMETIKIIDILIVLVISFTATFLVGSYLQEKLTQAETTEQVSD